MTILDSLIQGIIQGLTEFLPVSSSGHLALYQHFTGNSGAGSLAFSLMLHLGTLVAVVAAFYDDIWALIKEFVEMIKDIFSGRFSFKTDNPQRRMIFMLFLGTLPLFLLLPINGFIENLAQDGDIVVEGLCFLVTSGLLFLACRTKPGAAGIDKMRPRHALSIGVMQGVASMPGISRSGATISTGMILGFDRQFIVKYSFLLGIPAILGGSVLEVGDAVKSGATESVLVLFVGVAAAAVVGYLSIYLIRWLVLSDKFVLFAWYTLILGGIVVLVGIIEHVSGAIGPGAASVSAAASGAASPGSAAALLGLLG